jgi:hypothetical protein
MLNLKEFLKKLKKFEIKYFELDEEVIIILVI